LMCSVPLSVAVPLAVRPTLGSRLMLPLSTTVAGALPAPFSASEAPQQTSVRLGGFPFPAQHHERPVVARTGEANECMRQGRSRVRRTSV
jgi:hypothetical protein